MLKVGPGPNSKNRSRMVTIALEMLFKYFLKTMLAHLVRLPHNLISEKLQRYFDDGNFDLTCYSRA